MTNLFASLVMYLWPVAALQVCKKYSKEAAIILIFMVPYLFLPQKTGFKLPLFPYFEKKNWIGFIALIVCRLCYKNLQYLPKNDASRRLMILMVLFPAFTVLGNQDDLFYGPLTKQGLGFADYVYITFNIVCSYIIPFSLAFQFLRSEASHKLLIRIFVGLGLIYAMLVFYEVAMSPQLHSDIYGLFPHEWRQMKRDGGFRPVVFLSHALRVSIFLAMAAICALILFKKRIKVLSVPSTVCAALLVISIIAAKSLGAFILFLIMAPVVLALSAKKQVFIAAGLSAIFLFYPMIRGFQVIDTEALTNFVSGIDENRAASLSFRFNQEDILLEKASERPIFGWGSNGRNRNFHPITGRDQSVIDGAWIIVYSTYGWTGYIAIFGIMSYPLFAMYALTRKKGVEISPFSACLCAVLAINLIDMLPNSSISVLTLLISGAIMGYVDEQNRASKPIRGET